MSETTTISTDDAKRAFERTIFWNNTAPWSTGVFEPEPPLEVIDPAPPAYLPVARQLWDGDAVLVRFHTGEFSCDVCLLPPQGDDADAGNVTSKADAAFIANLPVFMPVLLSEIKRLREALVALRSCIHRDKARNATWLHGEAWAVHVLEDALATEQGRAPGADGPAPRA